MPTSKINKTIKTFSASYNRHETTIVNVWQHGCDSLPPTDKTLSSKHNRLQIISLTNLKIKARIHTCNVNRLCACLVIPNNQSNIHMNMNMMNMHVQTHTHTYIHTHTNTHTQVTNTKTTIKMLHWILQSLLHSFFHTNSAFIKNNSYALQIKTNPIVP